MCTCEDIQSEGHDAQDKAAVVLVEPLRSHLHDGFHGQEEQTKRMLGKVELSSLQPLHKALAQLSPLLAAMLYHKTRSVVAQDYGLKLCRLLELRGWQLDGLASRVLDSEPVWE